MSENSALFTPLTIGDTVVKNRVFMAPLTRNRAHGDGTPGEMAIEYYRQRAGAGLIVTEATQISPEGKGYIDTPGIHSPAHVAAWRKITDAVHAEGGRIFLQLWHVGRVSHTSLQHNGQAPVAPSAITAATQTVTEEGFVDTSAPRALTLEEMPRLVEDFAAAARNAKEAGFDGVEVHAANGYLLDQFLNDGSNKRDDQYGGAAANRARILMEILDAVSAVWGAGNVGVRLSPFGTFNDISDSDREGTFSTIYRMLASRGLAYLHVVELFPGADADTEVVAATARLRAHWPGVYIANGGFDGASAAARVSEGSADAVTFGRPYIANPDLAERIRSGAALNEPDESTFYGGGTEGYIDYPSLPVAAE